MAKRIKTGHAGAKNGGGYWGKRVDAKERSRKLRRGDDKEAISGTDNESAMHHEMSEPRSSRTTGNRSMKR